MTGFEFYLYFVALPVFKTTFIVLGAVLCFVLPVMLLMFDDPEDDGNFDVLRKPIYIIIGVILMFLGALVPTEKQVEVIFDVQKTQIK